VAEEGGMSFHEKYRNLEDRFRVLAEADGDVYLPNVAPSGSVRCVFIAMEPSLGRWARSPQEARARVEAGFRNFIADQVVDVVLLHHAIRHYLGTESYHLTDFSKGAMLTAQANIDRTRRYDRWYQLLRAELALVGPEARIFAVGKVVASHLRERGIRSTPILHYSNLAGRARAEAIRGHESEFEAFRRTVSYQDVLATAKKVLELVPVEMRKENRLWTPPRTRLTTSELALLFAYKLAFTELGEKPSLPLRAPAPNPIAGRSIQLGSTVQVRDLDRDLDREWTIVEATKADPRSGSFSDGSPIGIALVGHVEGDVVEVQAPAGVRRLKVVAISARVGEGQQQTWAIGPRTDRKEKPRAAMFDGFSRPQDAEGLLPKRRQTATCRYCGRTHPATAQFWFRNKTPENGPPVELEQVGAEGELLHLRGRCKVCEAEYRSKLRGGTR
jgi:hypothetical protein